MTSHRRFSHTHTHTHTHRSVVTGREGEALHQPTDRDLDFEQREPHSDAVARTGAERKIGHRVNLRHVLKPEQGSLN